MPESVEYTLLVLLMSPAPLPGAPAIGDRDRSMTIDGRLVLVKTNDVRVVLREEKEEAVEEK